MTPPPGVAGELGTPSEPRPQFKRKPLSFRCLRFYIFSCPFPWLRGVSFLPRWEGKKQKKTMSFMTPSHFSTFRLASRFFVSRSATSDNHRVPLTNTLSP